MGRAAVATAAKPAKKLSKDELERRALADEFIGIQKKNVKLFAQLDSIKSRLKEFANKLGANFKEDFPGAGAVMVSCAKPKSFKGNVPTVVPEVFNALPKKEQDVLLKKGIIRMEESYTGAYYGAVEFKLY